jgi:hypothetical protein
MKPMKVAGIIVGSVAGAGALVFAVSTFPVVATVAIAGTAIGAFFHKKKPTPPATSEDVVDV